VKTKVEAEERVPGRTGRAGCSTRGLRPGRPRSGVVADDPCGRGPACSACFVILRKHQGQPCLKVPAAQANRVAARPCPSTVGQSESNRVKPLRGNQAVSQTWKITKRTQMPNCGRPCGYWLQPCFDEIPTVKTNPIFARKRAGFRQGFDEFKRGLVSFGCRGGRLEPPHAGGYEGRVTGAGAFAFFPS
jgi:hypothetical protein